MRPTVPQPVNLRVDPFEQHMDAPYYPFYVGEKLWTIMPAGYILKLHADTFKEFPPPGTRELQPPGDAGFGAQRRNRQHVETEREWKSIVEPRPPPGTPPFPRMAWIPGGEFLMGSEDFYPEERPVHRVSVDGFWMDEFPVTAAQFRRFVRETGYETVAERPLDPEQYPDADPGLLVPGSSVFVIVRADRSRRLLQLVGVRAGRVLETAGR